MSYLVLARKYRPSSFADIIGQEHAVRTLQNAIKLDRVHHAFLFTGARGVGKTTTARVLARALNCDNGPTPEPCGTCPTCTEIVRGVSPDVLEIDGASNNGVEAVRELRENVRYLPQRGRFKLYIIDEVHMLSQAAFNALLKTLEEPPAHVKFIFATTEPHKIPVTILSRCQRFDFKRVAMPVLSEHLRTVLEAEQVKLGPGALAAVVREAQGSVRDAMSLLDQVLSYTGGDADDADVIEALGVIDRQTIFALADAIIGRDANALLQLMAEVDQRGHDLADIAALLVEHLRDIMVAKVMQGDGSKTLPDRSPGEIESLQQQATTLSRPDLHRLFALAVRVAEDVARSRFARVSLEMGLLRLLEVEPSQSLSTLLERLDGLVTGSTKVSAKARRAGGDGGGKGPSRSATPEPAAAAQPAPSQQASTAAADSAASKPPTADTPPAVREAPSAPTPVAAKGEAEAPPEPAPSRATPQPERAAPPVAHKEREPTPSAPSAVTTDDSGGDFGDSSDDDGSGGTAWARLVERVRGARPALASVLEHARVIAFAPTGVEIGLQPGTFYWDAVRDADNRAVLNEQLAQQFGQKVSFELSAVEPSAAKRESAEESLADQAERRRSERLQKIDRDGRNHPVVQSATRILGGEVKKVVPLVSDDALASELNE